MCCISYEKSMSGQGKVVDPTGWDDTFHDVG